MQGLYDVVIYRDFLSARPPPIDFQSPFPRGDAILDEL